MFRYWKGLLWIRQGFCPYCYSSPPNPKCPVCEGTYEYSYNLAPGTRDLWRKRWDEFYKVFHT